MKLSEKRILFTQKLGLLLVWCTQSGYDVAVAYVKRLGNTKSFHYDSLAVDIDLYVDGVYQTDTSTHYEIGQYWKYLGGTWGGDFKNKDGNHYSWGE